MIITTVKGFPKLHNTPLALISYSSPKAIVELDDENGRRLKIIFNPCQALKIVTADCFNIPDGISIIPHTIMEIKKSPWVNELNDNSKLTDYDADFMDNTKHFLLPLQDDFLEVLAWNIEYEAIE